MDLNKLSTGEKIAGGSAIALFIFMFFDWFTVEVSGGAGRFTASASEGGSAWDALEFIPIILVITIIAALAVVALRLADSGYEPPISANAVVTALGGLSVLLILYRIVDTPGVGGSFQGISIDVSPAFGIFISLLAAAGITYGGYKAMQEEGVSFGDVGDQFSSGGSGGSSSAPPAQSPPPAQTPPQSAPPESTPPSSPPPPPPPSGPSA